MTNFNLKNAADCLLVLSSAFPNFQVQELTAKLWVQVLGKKDSLEVEKAIMAFLATNSKFAPTIGEIYHIIDQMGDELKGGGHLEASYFIQELVKRCNGHKGLAYKETFNMPQIRATIKAIGWDVLTRAFNYKYNPHCAGMTTQEIEKIKGLICATYRDLKDTAKTRQILIDNGVKEIA